jgi:hypothetical protein
MNMAMDPHRGYPINIQRCPACQFHHKSKARQCKRFIIQEHCRLLGQSSSKAKQIANHFKDSAQTVVQYFLILVSSSIESDFFDKSIVDIY